MSEVIGGIIIPDHEEYSAPTIRDIQKVYCNKASCWSIECDDCMFDAGNVDKLKEWLYENGST